MNNVANFGVFELGDCEVLCSQSSSDSSLVFLHDWIGTWAAKNPVTSLLSLLEFLSSDCLCHTLAGINIFLDGFIPTVPGTKCLFVCIWCL